MSDEVELTTFGRKATTVWLDPIDAKMARRILKERDSSLSNYIRACLRRLIADEAMRKAEQAK